MPSRLMRLKKQSVHQISHTRAGDRVSPIYTYKHTVTIQGQNHISACRFYLTLRNLGIPYF